MEHRLVLDTVNEVSHALLELVPWRAREGLDKLVSDANEQYKLVSDTIGQRVDEIDAAIQRSQQVMFIMLCIRVFKLWGTSGIQSYNLCKYRLRKNHEIKIIQQTYLSTGKYLEDV